jgi:DNA-binding transcriptional LysR family regulator
VGNLAVLTPSYPHQHLMDKQLVKAGIEYRRGQTVNLLDTQIGLVEAEQGVAVIPSLGYWRIAPGR